MDSQFFYFFVLVSFFLSMLVALKMGKNLMKKAPAPNLPPGPWKLPIIGHIHHLLTSTPHRKLSDLAKTHGSLMQLQLGEISAIVVSSPEYAREIFKTHDVKFASRPNIVALEMLTYGFKDIGFSPYGNYWRQLRKICTIELLTQSRINSFRPIREEELSNLIKRIDLQQGLPVNITELVLTTMISIISRAAFGDKCKAQEQFASLGNIGSIGGGFEIIELFPSAKWLQLIFNQRPKLKRLHRQLDQILENIVIQHKEAKLKEKEGQTEAEDLVDVLLKFQGGDDSDQDISLTNNNIKAILLDMFGAGGDTSALSVVWAMAELVRDPRVMKKAQDEVREIYNMKGAFDESCMHELKYVKSIVKETLRLHPPGALLLPRECREACEIDGYHIPMKTKLIVNAWAIGRDPRYWTEPERFYPERFIGSSIDYNGNNFEYIPFGAGKRICPGSKFGLMSLELALAMLLYHFDWKLPNGMKCEDLDMTEKFGVTVKRKDDLYLIPIAPPSSMA
ncbi:putative cytochrome P450 [Medicago truncatula]|uniref:Cytochrome P450 family 71 protein n=1 Tax=Medicago truncatula TaxID=3880 RepID=A0A072TTU5_MEDTR|nr:cytochrome P450 71D11 [Medicago truncatula]KEH16965.1 cytochrome P450 family 71 protein [Medicago truncatula]RHN59976.1 putative cytochrome P450 [Medicago truncatula]